jgi:hypothetical protein
VFLLSRIPDDGKSSKSHNSWPVYGFAESEFTTDACGVQEEANKITLKYL